MNLGALSIRYQAIILTAIAALMMWGVYSYFTMSRREDPQFTIRTAVVFTSWPGAPATRVEELITDALEEEIDTIEEVDVVRSVSINGQSTIYVDVEDEVGPEAIQNVWDKLRARVELVQMPEQGIKPIVNDEFGDTTILLYAIHQIPAPGRDKVREEDRYTPRQLELFADDVKDAIRVLPGAARVQKYGVQDEAVFIQTTLGQWSQIQLTTQRLQQLVEARNIVQPGGDIETAAGRFAIKPGGELDAVEEIDSIIADVSTDGDKRNRVYLRDLGLSVVRSYEDPPEILCTYADPDGPSPAVMVGLTMKSGANIVDLCDAAHRRVKELQEVEHVLPPDIAVTPVADTSKNVSAKINDVLINVLEAILIVVAVVFLVVGFRTAVVMAANIPVVVLGTLAVIAGLGVEMEQISLAAIIISLGLLVDNAVQVCDQARTNQMQGMPPVKAAVDGAATVASPMLMGTLTTIAAFAPMLISLTGGAAEYTQSLPITVSVTLGLSWVLATSFCVVLAAWFIRAPADPSKPSGPLPWLMAKASKLINRRKPASQPATEQGESFIFRMYDSAATAALKAKWITVAISVACFVLAMLLPVRSEFFPQDRRDQFAIRVYLPSTATIEETRDKVREVEEAVRKLSLVQLTTGEQVHRLRSMRTLVGGGGSRWYLSWNPESPRANFAEILIRTTNGAYTPSYATDIRRIAEKGDEKLGLNPIAGARVVPEELSLGPPAAPLEIRVSGQGTADMAKLREIADKVKRMVAAQPETWDVNDNWGVAGYQLHVDVDEDRANLAGVTNAQVAQTLSAYYSGRRLSTFREGDHLVPVYFRLIQDERNDVSQLASAQIEGANGKIPLDAIADIESRWEPARIERYDLNRTITVASQIERGGSGNDAVLRVMNSPEMAELKASLPAGFTIVAGGAYEESQDATEQMLLSFAISLISIVLLLVVQYNGWAKPLVILATLPLALIGAFFGLWITDNAMGFMPQLGLLSLFGIVLNTGIIFIEFADLIIAERASQENGDGPIVGLTVKQFRQCLIEAGKQRMLPIFLTTATTIGGLLPLGLAAGPLWEGMAWAMIFGLLIATVLTLLVVPALYAILVETFGVKPIRLATEDEE